MRLAFVQVYIVLKCARMRPGHILYFRCFPGEGDKVSKEVAAWPDWNHRSDSVTLLISPPK